MHPSSRPFRRLAAALATVGLAAVSRAALDPSVAQGKRLLYVMNYHELEEARAEVPQRPALIQHKADVQVDDRLTIEHLKKLGFVVETCDESGSIELTRDKDLVVISESVNANEIGPKYTQLTIPLVCWENDLYDDLRMTGKRLNVDYGTNRTTTTRMVHLWNAASPLAAGIPNGVQEIYTTPKEMNWGRPGLGAVILATVADEPEKVSMFAYEQGATMDYDFPAPARRLGLFLWENCFGALNEKGRALFDTALIWAVSPPTPAPPLPPGDGKQAVYIMNRTELEALRAEGGVDSARIQRCAEFRAEDAKVVAHLASLGFAVTVGDEHLSRDAFIGRDLVVISDSVNPGQIDDKFRGVPVSVVVWASGLYGEMGMTGNRPGTDYGITGTPGGKDGDRFIWLVNAPHPLDAGLRTDIIEDYYDDNEFVTNWGRPGYGATNIGITPGYPDRRTVFAYEKGSSLADGSPAPARRVGLFLCTHDFEHLLPEGTALLDAAFRWAAAGSPAEVSPLPGPGGPVKTAPH